MEKLLTIIVPAYNAEKTLSHCLDSFLVPKAFQYLEVLIIDDGSTDHTKKIAATYVSNHPQIFRLVSKENGGHGSGINIGSSLAKGKYFKVIDADDWIVSENLPIFLQSLEKSESDVILTNFHEIDMITGKKEDWTMHLPAFLYGSELAFPQFMEHLSELEQVLQFHGITYKTDFYRNLHHLLPEHLFYEDQEYSSIPFSQAMTVLPVNLFVYEYLVGNAEQSVSDANRVKRLWMLESIINRLLSFSVSTSLRILSAEQQNYLNWKLQGLIVDYYMICCILNKDRRQGREDASAFHEKIKASHPQLANQTDRKYHIFQLANFLHLNAKTYNRLLHSMLYQKIR